MRATRECQSWAVYRIAASAKRAAMNVVCEQREWDALQAATPGLHTLIRGGIANEGEAEQLARSAAA